MSTGFKCKSCGSTDIDEDNARGDAVCKNCGSVLEDSLIVSETQFEDLGAGATAIGQFVSADSSGGATQYGKFQVGTGPESREVTLKRAKKDITHLCQQLQLNQHYIDTAARYFKMALNRNLTRGRKSSHIHAACVYITCRTEGTTHLLIDISDVQQICSYALGRTYLKLTNALCINIPSVDPCLYILRFANKLQFGTKTQEVSNTALRIVQRMKKDSIHSGRRPTGLCGAALLIAARMHEFNRSIPDVVRIVKIHESTVRKRLNEFVETPSSSLTLEEFMSIDLEAEQDPPAFKAARRADKDRLSKNFCETELTSLQLEIDRELKMDEKKVQATMKRLMGSNPKSNMDLILEETQLHAIEKCLKQAETTSGIKPDVESFYRPNKIDDTDIDNYELENGELDLDGLDDNEIDNYILTHEEAELKNRKWNELNAEYIQEMKEREERLAKDREEGKPEKKKRKIQKKIPGAIAATAGEAIEKMFQEKKISNKINYDVLRTLTESTIKTTTEIDIKQQQEETDEKEEIIGNNLNPNSDSINVKASEDNPKNELNTSIFYETSPKTKRSRSKPAVSLVDRRFKVPKLSVQAKATTTTTTTTTSIAAKITTESPKLNNILSKEIPMENINTGDFEMEIENELEPELETDREFSLRDMLSQADNDDNEYYF